MRMSLTSAAMSRICGLRPRRETWRFAHEDTTTGPAMRTLDGVIIGDAQAIGHPAD
jgi:hypothetical protein